jgi:hypothetical protein
MNKLKIKNGCSIYIYDISNLRFKEEIMKDKSAILINLSL